MKAKVNLCMCNNCGSILIDHNPQVNAPLIEVELSEHDEVIKNGDTWQCPHCNTDGYLTDL